MIQTPYLLFLGDAADRIAAKVAQGIADWRPGTAVGQYRMMGCNADVGLKDMSVEDAVAAGAKTMVVGATIRGSVIPPAWIEVLESAMVAGMDIASGLHNLLRDEPSLVATSMKTGRALHDVRIPGARFPVASGTRRKGKRVLAVGTDCSVGKMYTGLAMEREMLARGMKASFRPTGQTGILITGMGVPLDAVAAKFMAGSVEWLTPENDADHWDIIEGQGSLFHASYSGVTMALIHGGQPDALILCHEPTRPHMRGLPDYSLPSLGSLHDLSLVVARMVNPNVKVAGISVNTAGLTDEAAIEYLDGVETDMDLPTVDPFRHGAARLVEALE